MTLRRSLPRSSAPSRSVPRGSVPRSSAPRTSADKPHGRRRLLAVPALLLAGALVASACDSSPFGVVVNGERIHQTAVNAAFRGYASSPTFVKAYETQTEQAGNPVTVQGAAAGTYSNGFAASVLDDLIQYTAFRQYLAAHHRLPDQQLLTVARAWSAAVQGPAWLEFSPSFRNQLTEEDAVLSVFAPLPNATLTYRTAQNQARGYLFSRVCVRQVAFTVTGPDGTPDFGKSLTDAKAAVSDGTLTGGVVTCYSLASLEREGDPLFHTVVTSDPGKPIAPQRTKFGYRVLEITQRRQLRLNTPMKQVISALFIQQGQYTPLQAQILRRAVVRLNPQYGTWDSSTASVVVNNASTA